MGRRRAEWLPASKYRDAAAAANVIPSPATCTTSARPPRFPRGLTEDYLDIHLSAPHVAGSRLAAVLGREVDGRLFAEVAKLK